MEIKELVKNTSSQIELLRQKVALLDGPPPTRIPIRRVDGTVSSFKMSIDVREKISQAQKDRWERERASKQPDKPQLPQRSATSKTSQLPKKDITFADKLEKLMKEKSP